MKELRVKDWFINKAQETASRYNTYIDTTSRDENGKITADENGYIVVVGEVEAESEKALKVRLSTGEVLGSCKGWSTWIPKSVIA